ncbi:MAG: hypothetical protein AAFN41_00935, partial [Planctomycetota bacterium]
VGVDHPGHQHRIEQVTGLRGNRRRVPFDLFRGSDRENSKSGIGVLDEQRRGAIVAARNRQAAVAQTKAADQSVPGIWHDE